MNRFRRFPAGGAPQARGFTGHEHIRQFNLINMNARLYGPRIGRFLSPDSYIPDPENPQSYNRYSYVLNNPLKYVDPTGNSGYIPYQGQFEGTNLTMDFSMDGFSLDMLVGMDPSIDLCDLVFSAKAGYWSLLNTNKYASSFGGGGGGSDANIDGNSSENGKYPRYAKATSQSEAFASIMKNFTGLTNSMGMCIWVTIAKVYKDVYNKEFPGNLLEIAEDPNHGKYFPDGKVGTPEGSSEKSPAEDFMRDNFNAEEVDIPAFDIWNKIGVPLLSGDQVILNLPLVGGRHAVQVYDIEVFSPDSYNIRYWDCNNPEPILKSMNSYYYQIYNDKPEGVWGWILRKK
ncbi:MAG: RHS repeat domain-containing protein [Chloroflexota bacterium]